MSTFYKQIEMCCGGVQVKFHNCLYYGTYNVFALIARYFSSIKSAY